MTNAAATTRRPTLGLPGLGLAGLRLADLPGRPAGCWQPTAALPSSALTAGVAGLAERGCERLVLFLPLLILPTVGGLSDLWLLAGLFVLVAALEALLWPPHGRADRPGIGALLAALAGLGVWLALGAGAALTLGLFVLVRAIESRVPTAFWAIRFALAALACALLLDLALVGLGLERGILWPALAAAIGAAGAAVRQLEGCAADAGRSTLDAAAIAARARAFSETLLVAALVLVLALYAALLAHEPTLGLDADNRHFLALPLLAAAVIRLARLTLDRGRKAAVDLPATLLLASWATVGLLLGGT